MSTVSLKHSINGRLRLKLTAVKNSQPTANAVERVLLAHKAVNKCIAKPVTGSVIIHFDPVLASDETFLQLLKEEGFYSGDPQWEENDSSASIAGGDSLGQIIFTKAIEVAAERAILALL